ncbi:hypothetical protein AMAG_13020 [Allomyces macrogynus ATCC 38327]|uniref:PCI domain-containing protein n=1 Tax=Allomyces macrogynus (strain ATCC 38327) TaxID=578462 RepID=A0A0L0T0T3_ALLM3|nr:hypothetical protein AMAG_13020 [Allomyces macrogynus ATCC 38327]|eukprot:KNE68362.1 hypothetical protein AMAG_13020 [Allomyces macrogynus ATCC 38327]
MTKGDTAAMDVDPAPAAAPVKTEDAQALFLADIKHNVALLEKAVAVHETRFVTRVLRTTSAIRRRLTQEYLVKAIAQSLPAGNALASTYLSKLDADVMQTDDDATATPAVAPEVETYLGLLTIVFLHDQKKYQEGLDVATSVVQAIQHANRRSLDQIAAKVYFYYARFHELLGFEAALRPALLAFHRTATLRHDHESTATLLNLILRSLLNANLIEQADKLMSKSGGLPATASNNQLVRFMYYQGRIKAIQLDYSASHNYLQQAIRKAPQTAATTGFLQAATKLAIIVQLLMGEVPDRAIFRPTAMRVPLEPYRQLVLAVRQGDLVKFNATVKDAAPRFAADRTQTLIARLRHNVIKTGMRLISVAYAAISLRDICARLGLDGEEDAEFMVAKAIKDGVITATIDHARGIVVSSGAEAAADVYATREPQVAFHHRIQYCLDLHNQSVQAMRYPDGVKKSSKAFSDLDEMRELEKEIQQSLEEDDEDF